jgi:Flp pilus assembly protein TadD
VLRPRDNARTVHEINTLYEQGKNEEARGKVDAYLAKYPKSSQGHRLKGWIEFSLDNNPRARSAFHRALALDPEEDNAHVGLGAIARRDGKLDVAREHYQKSIQIKPKNPEALASLVVIELQAKNYAKAVQLGERARTLDQDNAVVLANLSVAYHYVGDTKKRDEAFELAKKKGYRNAKELERIYNGKTEL